MAFANTGTKMYHCALCSKPAKWFQMMESENEETHFHEEAWGHVEDESEGSSVKRGISDTGAQAGSSGSLASMSTQTSTNRGISGAGKGEGKTKSTVQKLLEEARASDEDPRNEMVKKYMRVCMDCELTYRIENAHLHEDDPEWATMTRVKKDMKSTNKGQQWVNNGMHFKAAAAIIEKQIREGHKMSRSEQRSRKQAKCKELAQALAKAIKGGRLFQAFVKGGVRLKISAELDQEVDKAYKAYLDDPENEEKFKALEALEEKVAKAQDYRAAGGDTEKLKALDYHNDMSEGFNVFDLCRRKVFQTKLSKHTTTHLPKQHRTHRSTPIHTTQATTHLPTQNRAHTSTPGHNTIHKQKT